MAAAILRDDFQNAAKYVKRMEESEVSEKTYQEWPIFKEFRKSQYFLDAIQLRYGDRKVIFPDPVVVIPE